MGTRFLVFFQGWPARGVHRHEPCYQAVSAVPTDKPERPENTVLYISCRLWKCEVVAIRGVSDGSLLAIYQNLSYLARSALLRVARVLRVCAMHPLYFMGTLRVSASYLSFLAIFFPPLLFCYFCLVFVFLCFRWSFVDVPLGFSSPADHVLDW